jgi:acyl-CoA dehydrogenase
MNSLGPAGFDAAERSGLRALARRFTEREVLPGLAGWEDAGEVPRELSASAGAVGLLGVGYPEAVGGGGGDRIDALVVAEEMVLAGASTGLLAALFTHGIALPPLLAAGGQDLVRKVVPPVLAGRAIAALAVTEPDAGSDVAALRTRAVPDGDGYLVNGTKTYTTSGMRADWLIAAVRTGGPGAGGLSLLAIPGDVPGLQRVRRLEKMGWRCSDTAELAFVDVRVPAGHRVGQEGEGFALLARQFVGERLSLSVQGYAVAQRCLDLTLDWVRRRSTFGAPLASRQAVAHRVAEMARLTDVARSYVRAAAVDWAADPELRELVVRAALAKNTAVAACRHVVDEAVQLHGGFGYLRDAEVERHYRDARILAIGGGTTEMMTEIVARSLGLGGA